MAFNIEKPKKKEEKDLYSLPRDNMDEYKDDNKFETEQEKKADIFSLPKEDDSDGSLFRTREHEIISDLNDELRSEEKPIEVISKDHMKISANGKIHDIRRSDLIAYQKAYHLEDGMNVPISRYRRFGSIEGHHEALDQIGLDVRKTFAKIDEKLGGMSTLADEEY